MAGTFPTNRGRSTRGCSDTASNPIAHDSWGGSDGPMAAVAELGALDGGVPAALLLIEPAEKAVQRIVMKRSQAALAAAEGIRDRAESGAILCSGIAVYWVVVVRRFSRRQVDPALAKIPDGPALSPRAEAARKFPASPGSKFGGHTRRTGVGSSQVRPEFLPDAVTTRTDFLIGYPEAMRFRGRGVGCSRQRRGLHREAAPGRKSHRGRSTRSW